MINEFNNDKKTENVPIWEKHLLTINEAAQFFNMGQKKLRNIAKDDLLRGNAEFTIANGNRILFKREEFMKYLNKCSSI